jgi:flagellar hook-length control protein FliK
MDSIRLGPSKSADGAHAVRQKPGAETEQTSGVFSALLSGLGAQSSVNLDAPASPEEPKEGAGSLNSALDAGAAPTDGATKVLGGPAAAEQTENVQVAGTGSVKPVTHQGIAGGGIKAIAVGSSSTNPVTATARAATKRGADKGTVDADTAEVISQLGAQGRQGGDVASVAAQDVPLGTTGDGALLPEIPAASNGAVVGGRPALKGKSQAALPEQGASVSAQDAAMPFTLALPSGGLGAGGGVVAQTSRMDASVASTKIGAANVSRHRPSLASPATSAGASAALSGPLRTFPQAAGLTQTGAQGAGAGLLGTHMDPRALSESGQLQATSQKAAEKGAGSVSDVAGLVVATPLPIDAGASTSDFYRDRTELPGSEHSGFGATTVGQAWAESGGSVLTDLGHGIADGMAASPEDAVAEQVTYWLSESLKNAELTVEHAGQPVDVRVSLAGNEAHVAFHSDQAQTRELLTDKMEQLRELLRGEGLVLSGATVDAGTSGQTGDQGGRSAPFGAPTTNVLAVVDKPAQAVRRTLTSSSVDLYV